MSGGRDEEDIGGDLTGRAVYKGVIKVLNFYSTILGA